MAQPSFASAACPDDEQLAELLELTEELGPNRELAQHCENCSACASRLEDLRNRSTAAAESHLKSMGSTIELVSPQPPGVDNFHVTVKALFSATDLPTANTLSIGSRLGEYELQRELGRGGMGVVFLAWHPALRRQVAIKVPHVTGHAANVRVLREARSVAKLSHPHICRITDMGEADGVLYLVFEYMPGETLSTILRRSTPSERFAAEWTAKLARAIAYAHELEIVHRDIKPGNVILSQLSNEPVLMDFGLAKILESDESGDAAMTLSGQILGTPAYMAPEQAAGRVREIGKGADVYGLGAVLYHLLTGRPPYLGTSGEVIRQVQNDDPSPPRRWNRRVPRDLEAICLQAMAREINQRYSSAAGLADDLERYLRGESISARRVSYWQRSVREIQKRPRTFAAGTVAVALMLAVIGWAIQFAAGRNSAAQVTRDVARQVQTLDATRTNAESIETRIQDLETNDPQGATELRQQLVRRFSQQLDSAIRNGTEPDRMESELEWLRIHDRAEAERLVTLRTTTTPTWKRVLAIEAPFENVSEWFPPGEVYVVERNLARTSHSFATQDSKVSVPGDFRVSVTLELHSATSGWTGVQFRTSDTESVAGDLEPEYAFLIEIPQVDADSNQNSMECPIMIQRSGTTLMVDRITLPRVIESHPQLLHLSVERRSPNLRFVINGKKETIALDLFPSAAMAPTRLGFLWPYAAGLRRAEVEALQVPVAGRLFSVADERFQIGDWQGASLIYKQQRISTDDVEVRSEATYKTARCLEQLGQLDEATSLYRELAGDKQYTLYHILAVYRLWSLEVQAGNQQAADLLIAALELQRSERQDFAEMAAKLPYEERLRLLERLTYRVVGWRGLLIGPGDISDIEQAALMQSLIDPRGTIRTGAIDPRWPLMRAYHLAGRFADAERIGAELCEIPSGDFGGIGVQVIEERCWMLRLLTRHKEALALATQYYDSHRNLGLAVERTRCLVIMGKFDEAETFLQEVLEQTGPLDLPEHRRTREMAAAHLLLGWVLNKQGKSEQAQEVWRTGRLSVIAPDFAQNLNGQELMIELTLASLTRDFRKRDLTQILSQLPLEGVQQTVTSAIRWIPAEKAIEGIGWSDTGLMSNGKTEGEQFVDSMILQTEPLSKLMVRMLVLAAFESVRNEVEVGINTVAMTTEQKVALLEFFVDGFEHLKEKQIETTALPDLMLSWVSGDWAGAEQAFPVETHAHLSLIFGLRVRAIDVDLAHEHFQRAQELAPPDSVLAQAIQQALDSLESD